jgi:outer membrane protein
MRIAKIVFLMTCVFCLSAGFSGAADVAKIGVFDFPRILEISSAGKAAQEKLKEHGQRMADELKAKGLELQEFKERLEREAMVLTEDKRQEKEREFRIKVNDIKALQQKFKKEFRGIEEQLKNKITQELIEIIADIGKKEGYLLVIELSKSGVWYYPTALDITDQVIREYNTAAAKKLNNKTE